MHSVFNSKSFFISTLVLLHVLFFFHAVHSGNMYLHNDSDEYLHQAENIKSHHSWYAGDWNEPVNNYLDSRRPPLTGFFIMLVKAVNDTDAAVCFAQCLLSIFNILLVIKMVKLFLPQWSIYSHFILLLLFFPSQLIYANMIMAEVLFQSMLLLSFYFMTQYFVYKKTSAFLFSIIFLTLAVLTKPVLYLFWIPYVFFLAWLLIKNKIKLFQASFIFIFLSAIFFISYHNYLLNGVFQYSSVHENHVTDYSVRNTLQFKEGKQQAEKTINEIISNALAKGSYKEYHDELMSQCNHLLWEYRGTFSLLQFKGMISFFIDPARWDIYSFFSKPPGENMNGIQYYFKEDGIKGVLKYIQNFNPFLVFYLIISMVMNVVITVSFFFFLVNRNVKPGVRWVALLLVFYIAFVTGLMGSARYRMAVFPILLFAFPFGFEKLRQFSNALFHKPVLENMK